MGMTSEEERAVENQVAEETRRKISEGMKRSHAKRKRMKSTGPAIAKVVSPALRQLLKERDELNIAIQALQRRGL